MKRKRKPESLTDETGTRDRESTAVHRCSRTEEAQVEKQAAVAFSQVTFERVMRSWSGSQAAGCSKSVEGGK